MKFIAFIMKKIFDSVQFFLMELLHFPNFNVMDKMYIQCPKYICER